MANRRFTQFSDRTLGADEPRPKPSLGSKKQPRFDAESTAGWPGAPGKKGPDFNRRVKMPRIKAHAKSDL